MVARFQRGDVGNGEAKLFSDMRRKINQYLAKDPKGSVYVNHSALMPACTGLSSFKQHKLGVSGAFKLAINELILAGELLICQDHVATQVTGKVSPGKMYQITDSWQFN